MRSPALPSRIVGLLLGVLPVVLAGGGACDAPTSAWQWRLPPGFPEPPVPDDNPMSEAAVELGRALFYDKRLSGNETQACASCHRQELAFTDGRARSVGSTGEVHPRGAMSLANIAYASTLGWANPTLTLLERQALVPMFGEHPVELGLAGREDELVERLRADADMVARFDDAYGGAHDEMGDHTSSVTLDHITRALAAFQRTLLSGRSPFDRYQNGEDPDALSDAAKRGMALFFSEDLECFHCHGGFLFSDAARTAASPAGARPFHNTGLYNLDGAGAYPVDNTGLFEITGLPSDMGRFKAPTLRNIAVTAPYMHDGSVATLTDVIDHYAAGGRTLHDGPSAGVGSESPLKSGFVSGFELTADQRADLIAFLESLTDEEFLTDPRFADPGP